MTHKYALIIGNSDYDDSTLPNLKTPVQDARDLEALLKDEGIGAFDEVKTLPNATAQQMRVAIGELFGRKHKPDDLLLFYFSGHGELDEDGNLYLVAKDTQRGNMLAATGLDAAYIARYMNNARSRRQVIILDSCYSGAFGSGAKGSRVGTRDIFAGNGYGRYVLTASDALQLSWEGDRIIEGAISNSFFTHYLVEGLRSGTADRNGDGFVDIDELYDHIYEGMMRASGKQEPLKFTFSEKGDLRIARSPLAGVDRERERLSGLLGEAEAAAEGGDYRRAEGLIAQVIEGDTSGFLAATARGLLDEIMGERSRSAAYADIKRLLGQSPKAARAAWTAFTEQYPGYDPDALGDQVTAYLREVERARIEAQNAERVRQATEQAERERKQAEDAELARKAAEREEQKRRAAEQAELARRAAEKEQQDRVAQQKAVAQPAPQRVLTPSTRLMPAPFAWIEIPGKGYSIAKYPITNAQFAKFIDAGGYKEKRWWTQAGWQQREKDSWTQPRYRTDSKWNGAEQPVVGVSWYEAVAFCLWLSETTGEKIMLPTEDQWQYAAQGTDGRAYPWGNNWDGKRCNNNVVGTRWLFKAKPDGHGERTTPVRAYEGKGDSPFGVVDMAGNVWEWCLTDYEKKTNEVESPANCVLRGGSWFNGDTGRFRCDYRDWNYPYNGGYSWGFRIALS